MSCNPFKRCIKKDSESKYLMKLYEKGTERMEDDTKFDKLYRKIIQSELMLQQL